MATKSRQSRVATAGRTRQPPSPRNHGRVSYRIRLTFSNPLLKRDEADLVFVAGNIALALFDIIEWPVAALALITHVMARSRFKGLRGAAGLVEEVG